MRDFAKFSGRQPRGFTLVELIVVIVISGIVAVMLTQFILVPVQGFADVSRRAGMVDKAESALRRMQRDVRQALPNSVRLRTNTVTGTTDAACPNGAQTVCAIEMLNTLDGGRYRAGPPGDELTFDGADTTFEVIGGLLSANSVASDYWVVINNLSTTGTQFNAYNCSAVASHNCARLSPSPASTQTSIALAGAFPTSPSLPTLGSESQRFFIVDMPITYRCDTGAGTLTRHAGYTITPGQSDNPANGVPIADQVAACRMIYTPGTATRAGTVTITLTIADGTGEQVRLMHQIHVDNVP